MERTRAELGAKYVSENAEYMTVRLSRPLLPAITAPRNNSGTMNTCEMKRENMFYDPHRRRTFQICNLTKTAMLTNKNNTQACYIIHEYNIQYIQHW
jgi:hypothetical protein